MTDALNSRGRVPVQLDRPIRGRYPGMRRMRPRLLLCLLTAALLGAAAAPALADPPKLTINPGGTRFRDGHPQNHIRRGQDAPKLHGAPPKAFRDEGRQGHGRPHGHHFKGFKGHPVVVFPGRCWTEGYWAYQWVPQASPYHVWVAGHWSAGGTWVPGHYQTYYQGSGYYQPYWVEGYWSGC